MTANIFISVFDAELARNSAPDGFFAV